MIVSEIIEKLYENGELDKIIKTAKSENGCIWYGGLCNRSKIIQDALHDKKIFKNVINYLKENDKKISDVPSIYLIHNLHSSEFLKSVIYNMLNYIDTD